jgi:hypothetical protein
MFKRFNTLRENWLFAYNKSSRFEQIEYWKHETQQYRRLRATLYQQATRVERGRNEKG